jgi:hypothetical protein
MTMRFRNVKSAVEWLLNDYATAGGYRVLGYKDDAIDAEDLAGTRRLVQVFVTGGDFPKDSSFLGPVKHEVTLTIELLTAAKAQVDLSILESESATEAQIIAALAASRKASQLADSDLDEFVDVIFNVLMDNANMNLGIDPAVDRVANRWIPNWKKGSPIQRGETVAMSASMELSFRVMEDLSGVIPVTPTVGQAVKSQIKIATDEDGEPGEGLAGVLVGGN